MRKHMLAAACCLSLLASCNSTGSVLGGLSSAAPDISNDLTLACSSAENLLGLPKARGATGSIASVAATLNTGVTKFCTRAITDAPTIQAGLSLINTTAAILLGLGVAL